MLLVDVLSAALGRHSYFSKLVNIVCSNLLNLIYAVVAVGYISQVVGLIIVGAPIWLSSLVAIGLLLSAAPFEVMTSVAENATVATDYGLPQSIITSNFYYIIALGLSFLGSVQFFIRNYVLMRNFATTSIAKVIYQRVASYGYTLDQASLVGGMMGMASHFLLSYINWDQLGLINNSSRDHLQEFAFPVSLLFFTVAMSLTPVGQLVLVAISGGYLSYQLLGYMFESKSDHKEIQQTKKSHWINKILPILLPIGASLYFLVDFMNAFLVISQLELISPWTLAGCALLGIVSYIQKIQMWGKNLCFKLYHESSITKPLDRQYPSVAKWYWYSPLTRAVTAIIRELCLVGLDFFNNLFSYAFINQLAMHIIGCTIPLYYLHICTLAAFANRMVVQYFQAPIDERSIVSDAFKNGYSVSNTKVKNENHSTPASYGSSEPRLRSR
ncbi:hypothetical protein OAT84_02230 [Gammaproteobacteria bacterium]|nr:hypothetical protein [Gammaproteobacteria bacterium]